MLYIPGEKEPIPNRMDDFYPARDMDVTGAASLGGCLCWEGFLLSGVVKAGGCVLKGGWNLSIRELTGQ